MATNLISIISQALTPDILSRISSALNLDKGSTEKAVGVGVPALLAAFASRASTSEGAASLSNAISNQQPGAISSMANALGGASQTALIDNGRNALTSLLGSSSTNALTGAMDKFAGIGGTASKSMLGLLGPVVMGVLGQQQKTSGQSITQLLTSQKDNIARAMPAGFAKQLGEAGIMDTVTGAADSIRGTAASYGQQVNHVVENAGRRAENASSGWGWLLPALAVLALGSLAWHLLSGPRTSTASLQPAGTALQRTATADASSITTNPVSTTTVRSVDMAALDAFDKLKGVKVGDIDMGARLTNVVDGLRTTIGGIKDEASARAVVPALTNSGSEFAKLAALGSQLAPDARRSLASAIAAVKPALDQMFDKALAVPGVGSVLKPTADNIRSKLDMMANA